MDRKLGKTELLGKLKAISQPKAHGLTQETFEKTLIDFCAGPMHFSDEADVPLVH
jgi:hypothetical protein